MDESKDNQEKKEKKKGRKVRVDFRRNRSQTPRDKNWTREYQDHGFKDKDTIARESHIPKGDLSRKRTIIEDGDLSHLDLHDGRVITMRGLIVEVDDGGQVWPCTIRRVLRTRLNEQRHPITVGVRVQFIIAADEDGIEKAGVIYEVYPRNSQLTRHYFNRVHVIVANVNRVLIVSSVDEPTLKPHLIDRYLVSAHAGGIEPVVCINKIDLGSSEEVLDVANMYRQIGYKVILCSAHSGQGIQEIKEALLDQETVIVGQSGVGKSTLLNAIQPGLSLETAAVSDATSKGKHTTTTTCLLKLDIGGYVVDTPGIRSYDLAVVPNNEFEMHFIEFVEHVPGCKFPDCTHTHEDECAIKEAVATGKINPRRHESYVRMFNEEEFRATGSED